MKIDLPTSPTWDDIRKEIERLGMLIFNLEAVETNNRITLCGNIGSEAEKAALEELVRTRFKPKPVFNRLIVTGVFKSASQSHFDNLI